VQSFSGQSPVGLMTTFYSLKFETPQPGGPDPRIYIPQEQGSPVMPPGTGLPFRGLLRLAGLRWRYSIPLQPGYQSFFSSRLLIYSIGNRGECLLPGCCHGNRTVAYQWTSASVRCCGNVCFASRWLATDFRFGSTIPTFRRHVTIQFKGYLISNLD
jgi:hypothetical protein